jgi:hypothetical protein
LATFKTKLAVASLTIAVSISGRYVSAAGLVPPAALRIGSDFEGALGDNLTDSYQCQGQFTFVPIATPENPKNQALSITLDPKAGRAPAGTCESLRGEVAEKADVRLPLQTEVWYSLRFLIPSEIKGKIRNKRFVLAQLQAK